MIEKVGESPDIGMSRADVKRWSFVKAIRSLSTKEKLEGLEKECSETIGRKIGESASPSGFYIPFEVFHGHPDDRDAIQDRDLSATGAGNLGRYTIQTDVLGASFVELLRNRTVALQMGAQMLSGLVGDVAIPSQAGAATAAWLAENDAAPGSNLTFGQIGLTPHRIGAVSKISKRLIAQSSVDVERIVRNDFSRVLGIAVDLAALAGTGSGGQPLGILNTPGVGSVNFGAAATFAKLLDFETQVANANAELGPLGYALTPNTRVKLRQLRKISGSTDSTVAYSDDGKIAGHATGVSKQLPSDKMIYGNWEDLIIANWLGSEVTIDPLTLADQHQVKAVVNLLADICVRHVGSFTVSTDSAAQ